MGLLTRMFGWLFGPKREKGGNAAGTLKSERLSALEEKTAQRPGRFGRTEETSGQERQSAQTKERSACKTPPSTMKWTSPPPRPGIRTPPLEFGDDPQHRRARRIARGMLSDLKEYHADKLKMAVINNTFEQVFDEQLKVIRENYRHRVSSEIMEAFDYLEYAVENLKAEMKENSSRS